MDAWFTPAERLNGAKDKAKRPRSFWYVIFSDFWAFEVGYSLQNIQWGLNEVREIAIMRVPLCFYSPSPPIILSTPRLLGTGTAAARDIFLPDFYQNYNFKSAPQFLYLRIGNEAPEKNKDAQKK